ncbi:hypothetical protein A5722_14745 [Mycobacterium vulneris]|nr:hypothetical protein A5722_14745 [Mycolicibacterium vulneris]OCB66187.1 hypothetical protein A5729_12250 [Mycolicibacterium vulneris]
MPADPILEARFPLGDAAGLLDYRRTETSMKPIDPRRPFGPLGHTYIAIAVDTGEALTRIPTLAELVAADLDNERGHDLISAALIGFGIVLALVAFAMLLAITKGSAW